MNEWRGVERERESKMKKENSSSMDDEMWKYVNNKRIRLCRSIVDEEMRKFSKVMHKRVIQNSFVLFEYFIKWLCDVLIKENKFLMLLLVCHHLCLPLFPHSNPIKKHLLLTFPSRSLYVVLECLLSKLWVWMLTLNYKIIQWGYVMGEQVKI